MNTGSVDITVYDEWIMYKPDAFIANELRPKASLIGDYLCV